MTTIRPTVVNTRPEINRSFLPNNSPTTARARYPTIVLEYMMSWAKLISKDSGAQWESPKVFPRVCSMRLGRKEER